MLRDPSNPQASDPTSLGTWNMLETEFTNFETDMKTK